MISNRFKSSFLEQELKERLFDLMTFQKHHSFESFLVEMCKELRDFIQADYVGVYRSNGEGSGAYFAASEDPSASLLLEEHYFEALNLACNVGGQLIYNGSTMHKQETYAYDYVIPLEVDGNPIAYLNIAFHHYESANLQPDVVQSLVSQVARFMTKMESFFLTQEEEEKYELLYKVTTKFHSSMNVNDVLRDIIDTLKKTNPKFHYYLLLSHDYSHQPGLPVKDLIYEYDGTSRASAQAYLMGEIQFEDLVEERKSCLYAPLKGKQGVYGVLQIVAPSLLIFPKKDVEFIRVLANTAGIALENARLYQQSRKYINDLQFINETSHKLNANLRLSDTVSFMRKQFIDFFEAEEVGFIICKEAAAEEYDVLKGSTSFFLHEGSDAFIRRVRQMLREQQDYLFVADASADEIGLQHPFQSLIAIPMEQQGVIHGMIVVAHRDPYFFSFDTFKLIHSLIHHSTLAFSNSILREELERFVQTDYLTKLYSRKYMDEYVQERMECGDEGAFLIIDIDNFKHINDTYGHPTGDEVIIQVSNLMKEKVGDKGITARWGGEELAIYLPHYSLEEALLLGEELVYAVPDSTDPTVTISCGIAHWSNTEEATIKDFFMRADQALYRAKQQGKNCIVKEK
ncbi:DeoR family transcriptional regulator [Pontibacillus halophilus JSM 076056 = DSM 19796]|uniref:DeoR family transcriptional regulator n=1 Tax=Pontibacillus halophilus JSM 076056 = DSM 19796 TaxID=1385510 RepID=A0A0A5GMW4_9BACI|nr:diguanylate cyclase [Pontibacillus halophilus]KGX93339.1 DeoR family transcriptional regulator [Pontibacillus halophilus JSM 076056 = DSM 19796]